MMQQQLDRSVSNKPRGLFFDLASIPHIDADDVNPGWCGPASASHGDVMLVRCPEFSHPVMAVKLLETWVALCEDRPVNPSLCYTRNRRSLESLRRR